MASTFVLGNQYFIVDNHNNSLYGASISRGFGGWLMETLFIRQRRLRLNMSQEELAKLIGIGAPQVSHWESGKRFPNSKNRAKIAGALRTDVASLFRDPDELTTDEILMRLRAVIPLP